MTVNRSMPSSTIIPELPYASVTDAAEWLEKAFGFSVRLRIGDHRIQMNAGDGHIVVVEARETSGACRVMMRVVDVDAHYARALAAGAQVSPPETHVYGERQYSAIDCGGHVWKFSQSVADVTPESWGGESGQL